MAATRPSGAGAPAPRRPLQARAAGAPPTPVAQQAHAPPCLTAAASPLAACCAPRSGRSSTSRLGTKVSVGQGGGPSCTGCSPSTPLRCSTKSEVYCSDVWHDGCSITAARKALCTTRCQRLPGRAQACAHTHTHTHKHTHARTRTRTHARVFAPALPPNGSTNATTSISGSGRQQHRQRTAACTWRSARHGYSGVFRLATHQAHSHARKRCMHVRARKHAIAPPNLTTADAHAKFLASARVLERLDGAESRGEPAAVAGEHA